MAGLGSRFAYQFKPFILATEHRFIELAKQPFDVLPEKQFYFIIRAQQETDYQVTTTLQSLFPHDTIHICVIPDTDGPLQTLQEAIRRYNIHGPSFVCDCDHRINITPMLEAISKDFDVLVPTWHIEPVDYPHWGKVKVEGGKLTFYEKELVIGKDVRGLIGCYLFRAIEILLDYPPYQNISDILKLVNRIELVSIQDADFFGTPALLQAFRYKRAQKYTLFIDVDGTLLHQTTREILPSTLDKLKLWQSQGHRIVLTTASSKPLPVELPHDHILYNLTPGPRYLINDQKPYHPSYTMAVGITLPRDTGIASIQLPTTFTQVLKNLIGGSTCQTFLLDNKRVRKYAQGENVAILKRQCEDIKRFNFYIPHICPTILTEYHGYNDYYYDMEYLEHYQTLSIYDTNTIYKVILTILTDLHEHVYCYQKGLKVADRAAWVKLFLEEKVYPRLHLLLPYDTIFINGQEYHSIQHYLSKINLEKMAPEYLCPIHGDLTLENILYNGSTYKLIDLAGSRYMDAHEQDIGKLLQSLVCRYAEWDPEKEVQVINRNEFIIPDKYLSHTDYRTLFENYEVCLFYMCMHLIRMVPFIMHKSDKHKIFVQLLATHYLKLLTMK